jgi:hypothetical protein
MYQEGEKYIYLIKTPFPYSYISFFFFFCQEYGLKFIPGLD